MFAGIDCARDWPQAGMTTARWLRLPPRPVLIGDLYATQDGVHLAPLLDDQPSLSHCGDPVPHVRLWNGRLYLEDGHHRAVRAAINGQQAITARVLEVGA
jgi:hypothetical protein